MSRVSVLRQLARRLGVTVGWLIAFLLAAAVITIAGIRIAGSVSGWQRFLVEHSAALFAWRVLLYTATVAGWVWMRRRVRTRDPSPMCHRQFIRTEVAAAITLVALEIHLAVYAG